METENTSYSFDRVNFAQTLLSALARTRGLQAIVDVGCQVLGNPVIISDKSWTALAIAPDIEIESDKVWMAFHNHTALPLDVVTRDVQGGIVDKLNHVDTPFFMPAAEGENRRILSNVIVGGRNLATMTVLEHFRPLSEDDFPAIIMLRDAVSAEMQKDNLYSNSRGMLHEDFLISLLSGRFEDPTMVEYRVNAIDQEMKSHIFVHVLDTTTFDRDSHSMTYIRNYLETLIPGSKAVIYDSNLVFIASSDTDPYADGRGFEELSAFLKESNIRAGVSRCFSDLSTIRTHYMEALDALTTGRHMHLSKYVYYYEDYAIYHICRVCAEDSNVQNFIHPKLLTLTEYDRQHDSSFTASLYAYLQCNRNITDTANRIHIHRNTLIYHLKRIEEILEVSLSDTRLLLHFEFSFRLMEYENILPQGIIMTGGTL